jgi:lysophospholipase L1-like esterase
MGGDPESSYQFWLKKGLIEIQPEKEYHIINEGTCGDTSRGIVSRLLHALETTHYDLVILAGGTNDLGMIGEKQVVKNLQEGYEACRKREIPLIAPSIPPISLNEYVSRIANANNAIEAYTGKFPNVFFADWFGTLKGGQGFLEDICNSGDGIHLSVEGYKKIGLLLVPIVNEALSLK